MSVARDHVLTILCLATYFKGVDFIRECKQQGCRVILLTKDKLLEEDWPRESIDDRIGVPNDAGSDTLIQAVNQLARQQKLDRLVALEEYDVINAALIREHLCMPGMSSTTARVFRDKLSMRVKAQETGIRVPEFVHALNYEDIGTYMNRVSPPWVLKPRSDVSAIGIKKLSNSEQVWRAIEELDARERLHERSPYHLLEQFIAGDVYHVDSLVASGEVRFAGVSRYGRPPMNVAHEGGVFLSATVEYDADDRKALLAINRQLLIGLGLMHGAAHAEFIKRDADGNFYFLEVAARVGGAYIAETLEAASGLNLWREWARIEIAHGESHYAVRPAYEEYSGIVLSLARQEYPDTSTYTDPEIAYRVKKRYHVGLIVRSPEHRRVLELLEQYAQRFANDFIAIVPPLERPE